MIEHSVVQNTPEWMMLRAGIPTASAFKKIITPAKLELSKSRTEYLHLLIAEWIQGCPIESPQTAYMLDGQDREDQTVAAYELSQDCEVEAVGFITTDDGMIGASPDRIIRVKNRGLEAKSPQLPAHVGYMLGGGLDAEYRVQILGQLWVCEFESVDIVSWNPLVPASALVIIHVDRDEVAIGKVAAAVGQFRDELMEARMLIEQRYGKIARVPQPKAQEDFSEFGITDEDMAAIMAAAKGAK